MSQSSYQVALPVFEGPLDLLLYLIEREELDITQVSLAQVTQQFLDYVAQVEVRDAGHLADFLVVAAKLLLIKSRALLPKPPVTALPAEEDIGRDLVQQLVEYRKFKEAAGWLANLQALGRQSYVRVAGETDVPHRRDLTGVTLVSLLAAMREALRVRPPERLANGTLPALVITVAQQIERVEGELARFGRVSFSAFLRQASGRLEIVVTLLAVLELVKRGRVAIRQDMAFGDIWITAVAPSEA